MMLIGILPTIDEAHLNADAFSESPRSSFLNEQIFAARGEDLEIAINGPERLSTSADTIRSRGACTSVQLHQQVEPEAFAAHWNAAQAIAGVQVAVAANSPFFFGKELWRETRIALFEQATERARTSSRPRVCARACGSASAGSTRSSTSSRRTCATSRLSFLCARTRIRWRRSSAATCPVSPSCGCNGTIYRWNRPIYDTVRGRPHVQVENRLLPAGPTVVDILANAAFYYGLIGSLTEAERPVWSQMSFSAAEENLHAGARDGIEALVYWPGVGEFRCPSSCCGVFYRSPTGLERAGLDSSGSRPAARDHRAALRAARNRAS